MQAWRCCARWLRGRPQGEEGEDERAGAQRDAIERVVESHDYTLLIGGAKLMIKQAAIRSARKLLAEWGREAGLDSQWWDSAPEYRAAKTELLGLADATIAQRVAPGLWIKEAWSQYMAREFNAEEADVIASHFQTEGGRKQRMLMDWYLGELVLFNYTFTDRFEYELKESENELFALQKQAQTPASRARMWSSPAATRTLFASSPAVRTAGSARA